MHRTDARRPAVPLALLAAALLARPRPARRPSRRGQDKREDRRLRAEDRRRQAGRSPRPQGQEGRRRRLPVVRVPRLDQLRPHPGRDGQGLRRQGRRLPRRGRQRRGRRRGRGEAGRRVQASLPGAQGRQAVPRPTPFRPRSRRKAFVLDRDFVLRYRGRIDDGYSARLKKQPRGHAPRPARRPRRGAGRQGRGHAGHQGGRLPHRRRGEAVKATGDGDVLPRRACRSCRRTASSAIGPARSGRSR